MRKLSLAVLIGGLLAVFVLAGCGGGGGSSNGGGGNPPSQSLTVTGNLAKATGGALGGYIVTFGGVTTTSSSDGSFRIQLPAGQSIRDLYPDLGQYRFSVTEGGGNPPPAPIFSVVYGGTTYDPSSIMGPVSLWTNVRSGTVSMGTIHLQ